MKGKAGPVADHLRPILDTYGDAAVALVGCASRGVERYSCEFDVLVVTSERRPPVTIRMGDTYADVAFVPEKDILKPADPEHALSLAFAKPVRDTSLVLSTSSATNEATISESAAKASRTRLASALKALGRAEAALTGKATVDADFWLVASAYEFAYAQLLSREVPPSPSHLLSQLRDSRGDSRVFEGVTMGSGLEAAGRAGCGARLEGVAVLHDLLRQGSGAEAAQSGWPKARSELMAAKANELVTRVELAECYSFLGQELVDAVLELLRRHPKGTLTTLTSGRDMLLGERLVRQLGLVRDEGRIRASLEVLKGQVGVLAKKS